MRMSLIRGLVVVAATTTSLAAQGNAVDPFLEGTIEWSIAHEGCPAYWVPTGGSRADALLPADELRHCFLRVEAHNALASKVIAAAPNPALTLATKDAIAAAVVDYRVRENLEWTMLHEGQLSYFTSLVASSRFAEIRGRYRELQNHNPNAVNALNALTDSELAEAVSQPRISISVSALDTASAMAIASYTSPSSTTLTMDTTLAALAKQTYGSSDSGYIQSIALVNDGLFSFNVDTGDLGSRVLMAGTRVVMPSLPSPGRVSTLVLKNGIPPFEALAAVSSLPSVRGELWRRGSIEKPIQATLQSRTVANVAEGGKQWYLQAIAADKMKKEDLGFSSQAAPTVVGVVDAGVDKDHPAIMPVLWELPPELATSDWPRGIVGYDFSTNAPDPAEEIDNSHGTHVTGLVTGRQIAEWLPFFDAAGLRDNVKAFSLKVAGADGEFDFTAAQNAIEDGITNTVHIFNLSLFGPYSKMLRDDLSRAERLNSTLFIVAAGNEKADLDASKDRHRTFRNDDGSGLANIIFVAALADDYNLWEYSSWGKSLVQLAAPGVEISSTVHHSGFGTLSGTSQAAPLVTFAAAILKAERPDLMPIGIKNRILNTCDWKDNLREKVASGCQLNLLKAVICGSDLLELRSGAVVRGDIDQGQFFSSGTVDGSLVRVWLANPATGLFVFSSGKKEQKVMKGKSIVIRLHAGEVCPHKNASKTCTFSASEVQDVVFRVK